jgi:hypothetical protein
MARGAASKGQRETSRDRVKPVKGQLDEILAVAQERGLLSGSRTHVIRGRMPVGLAKQAKLKSGISSDSKLLEAALASLAVSDDYAQWLLAQRGTVSPELNLEF